MTATKKFLAVVLATDDSMAFALAATLLSFKKNSPLLFGRAEFFVFTQNLSEQNKETLLKICPITFNNFKLPFDPSKIKTLRRYSELTMARYECFNMLDTYQNVLWLDIDLLILKEIEGLLAYNTGLAMAQDDNIVASNFYKLQKKYKMTAKNYNAGVLLLSDKLHNYKEIGAWCYEQTKKLAANLLWIDQAILNISVQHFNIKVAKIPRAYNANPFSSPAKTKDIFILHAMGEHKFWNNYPLPEWFALYRQWLDLGGLPFGNKPVSGKIIFAFKVKLLLEKIPFIWPFFVFFNKLRFANLNKKALKRQEK
ncbi:MAG: hypothetical protein LBM71_05820 [Elusimicrobiota bacterium]|jgi:lipopolysaccharide biosynthesis glycosyltransferase|nr:hypothetical protein [Elusimicrobiota bacterium]